MGQTSSSSRRRRYSDSDYQNTPQPFSFPPPPPPPPPPYLYGGGYSQPSYYQVSPHWPGWPPTSSSAAASRPPPPQLQPPPFVEHEKTTTVKNEVNLHKDSIRLEPDEQNPDHHLVSFAFDSLADGSFTISYFAKEGTNCRFSPVYPDMYVPTKTPFEKGIGQKFRQPLGSGIDLGFFELDDLSKPTDGGDVFPLVICAEAHPAVQLADEPVSPAAGAQITLAVVEKRNDGPFQVKVVKQILWIGGNRYELQEIFDLGISAEAQFDDDGDEEKDCVICMSEPMDTAVLPCRHMCMCGDCAKVLRLQSNKCPICRQPVEKLMEIPKRRKNRGHDGGMG